MKTNQCGLCLRPFHTLYACDVTLQFVDFDRDRLMHLGTQSIVHISMLQGWTIPIHSDG